MVKVDQILLFLVFLYLIKLYDILGLVRILKTLEGFGTGPKMRGVMVEFWIW